MDNELLGAFIIILLGMLTYVTYQYCMRLYESAELNFRFNYSTTLTVKKKEVIFV
mgnify:CR=1 FL=1